MLELFLATYICICICIYVYIYISAIPRRVFVPLNRYGRPNIEPKRP